MRQAISSTMLVSAACLLTFICSSVEALGWYGATLDGLPCTGPDQGFGPFDYFDIDEPSDPMYQEGRRWEIDRVHTDVAVRSMERAAWHAAAADLDYTLRAIPNDPRALQAVVQLNTMMPQQSQVTNPFPPPECYFQRAIQFRPKQVHVHLLYAIYLHKRKLYDRAIEEYQQAATIAPDSAEVHYNWGLTLVAMGHLEEAKQHAEAAYALGYPLPGLAALLKRHGIDISRGAEKRTNPHP